MTAVDVKNLGEISIEDLRQALISQGVEWAKNANTGASRIETRRSWMVDGREATDEEIDLFTEMPFVLGSAVAPIEPRELTQDEIDEVAYELTSVKKAKDVLDGRIEKIRSDAFDAFTFMARQDNLDDPEFVASEFVSEKHAVKIRREISGGKPYIDIDLAREVFGDNFDKVVNRIEAIKITYTPDGEVSSEETTVDYEINETALETQFKLGNITLDDLEKATLTTKKIAKFVTRKL